MFNLSGMNALVSGGSNGIGRAISIALANQGANITITGRNENALKDVSERISAKYIVCDFRDKSSVESLINQLSEIKFDILVNNAGMTKDQILWRSKREDFEEILNVNLLSAYELCKHFSMGMCSRRFGRIINISSVIGTLMGNAGQTHYGASKAALVGFSKCLAQELAAKGVTVNCLAPGFVETNMTKIISDEMQQKILANIPMKRFGSVDEIASSVVYLASKESSYITGQVISISGGLV
ncbi:3-oxoacyl-ACP reductase family protein [Candidatus Gromoviella agglomerans]|uniref:3-oxoacyl-ACP reductase family protein n=1 Tax=Candidatus Gromoviella agglomerans TaxID=2806609 RepID=UPI001E311E86|nr:3-oxoacyl-ACP reductase family protein [Candidatus Gromoviella agglomerans]UFX98168.1 3-oxoacyl-[acyl-carrier-protein] reductase FabG [Candidatus Gromoviella agglomerans]